MFEAQITALFKSRQLLTLFEFISCLSYPFCLSKFALMFELNLKDYKY